MLKKTIYFFLVFSFCLSPGAKPKEEAFAPSLNILCSLRALFSTAHGAPVSAVKPAEQKRHHAYAAQSQHLHRHQRYWQHVDHRRPYVYNHLMDEEYLTAQRRDKGHRLIVHQL